MGLFDFRRSRSKMLQQSSDVFENKKEEKKKVVCVGESSENEKNTVRTFDNSTFTFSGNFSTYDFSSILKDKQGHINDIYEIADYYADEDPIVHGIIKHVYVPYSSCSPWVLFGAKKKTRDMYEYEYKRIHLREKIESIFYEYWKYGNVFVYFLEDGNIITLPPHKCKIGNLAVNGKPLVDYDCQSIITEFRNKSYVVKEGWIKDNNLEDALKGYPKEIVKALNENKQYAQLNPDNMYVFQVPKESWTRYGIPFIVSCFSALSKKELISSYENALLNLGARSFVLAKYGDPKASYEMLPDATELKAVQNVISKAMKGFPLAVTNHLCSADVIKPDLDDMFQWDKYRGVNGDILSAGGINGILVSGSSDDSGTFASAQVSMQTAAQRIDSARDKFCEMMNDINIRLLDHLSKTHSYNIKVAPKFSFMPLDMSGRKALREACIQLWKDGTVSTETMLEINGYSIEEEFEKRQNEIDNGTDEVLAPRDAQAAQKESESDPTTEETRGRDKVKDEERNSDPENAIRSKQPKPSSPDGSMSDDESI